VRERASTPTRERADAPTRRRADARETENAPCLSSIVVVVLSVDRAFERERR